MNFEQILCVPLIACGVFLLVSAFLRIVALNALSFVFASLPFLAEVATGIFLVAFGLYLMKATSKHK